MSNTAEKFQRFPDELKKLNQWLLAGKRREPLAFDARSNSVVNAAWKQNKSCLMSFELACHYADHFGLGIGFILTAEDPFTCIDLDVKDAESHPEHPEAWTRQPDLERYQRIIDTFDSYTEYSTSGKGIHIWVYGDIGQGCRHGGVEVYSQERFIVCTGNVLHAVPIQNRQQWLEKLVSEIRYRQFEIMPLSESEEVYNDSEIWEKAAHAANADKFLRLASGNWQDMDFPSQSEADLALMSMLTFYSESNAQCKRIFRCTGLGLREKAVKNDRYLDDTLRGIRSRQAAEKAAELAAMQMARTLIDNARKESALPEPNEVTPYFIEDGELSWPPGLVGEIAYYIYSSAPRPVKEVAIATALGIVAGIVGKSWAIPQSGLNLYIILVGRSAIGKETIHSGTSALVNAMISREPTASNFVDFNDYASGPALMAGVAANPCFLNIGGEWGKKLRRMANDNDGPMTTLRNTMTHLFQKSSYGTIVGGVSYSKKENNIASVNGVSYSMLGETTPKTFYSTLTETMMEDGFLSRFLIIECRSDRPPLNESMTTVVPGPLVNRLVGIVIEAVKRIGRNEVMQVGRTPESAEMMKAFEDECDEEVRKTEDDSWRVMWNRAALKMKRISALLAVADNCYVPIVQTWHVDWALQIVRQDIKALSVKFLDGDIGIGDHSRERKLISILREYLTKDSFGPGYRINQDMKRDGVVTRSFISTKLSRVSSFSDHKLGANLCIANAINSLIDQGYIVEISKAVANELYGFQGKCYRIIRLPEYRLD